LAGREHHAALREATAAFGAGPGMLAAVTASDRRPWYRRVDLKLLAASMIVAVGVVLIVVAVSRSVTGDQVTDLPDAIESITPAPDAVQVLQQTQVIVDLAEGFEGRLIIDDVALATIRLDDLATVDVAPGEQVEVPPGVVFEPGNGTLTFTPGDESTIETFEPGSHIVTVIYWRTIEGEAAARSYTWTFAVI
jgi:hypothetical protein